MTNDQRRVIIRPPRIDYPISWRGRPGFLGLYTIYEAKFTDGSYRRVSLKDIEACADDY